MNASIISIGTELLSGRTINTNSTDISKYLFLNHIEVIRSLSIHDTKKDIFEALNYCLTDSDVCILTGGLGPTNDDITKLSLCEFFKDTLILNSNELERLENWFKSRNREMSEVNRQQAYYPKKSIQLINDLGTASAIIFEENGKLIISIPGVPHEMNYLMENRVIPFLRSKLSDSKKLAVSIFRLVNKAESDVFNTLRSVIESNPAISFAFYPNFMLLDLILKGSEFDLKKIEETISNLINENVYSRSENISLTKTIENLLLSKQETLCLAESCTGGLLSYFFTEEPGASTYFKGSLVSYSNEIKHLQLNISKSILETHGAVSDECVIEMAKQVRIKFKSTYALSVSGIAGPDGGTADKPVGTVYFGFSSAKKNFSIRRELGKGRHAIQNRAAQYAQFILWKELILRQT